MVAEKQRGVVEKEAAGGKAAAAGLIRAVDCEGGAALLAFAAGDVEPGAGGGRAALSKGDAVEFATAADRATGERWAVRVTAVAHEGVVDSVKDTYGYIRPDRPEESGGPVRLVVFYLNEVPPPAPAQRRYGTRPAPASARACWSAAGCWVRGAV